MVKTYVALQNPRISFTLFSGRSPKMHRSSAIDGTVTVLCARVTAKEIHLVYPRSKCLITHFKYGVSLSMKSELSFLGE